MSQGENDKEPLSGRLFKTGFLSRREAYREGLESTFLDGPERMLRKLHLEIERELDSPADIPRLFPHDINESMTSEIEYALEEFLHERRKLIKVLEYRKLSKACSMR